MSASTWSFVSNSEAETDRLGRILGTLMKPGTTVALVGDLGAGKTRLAQGIAAGLGADRQRVNSPTFVLVQEYPGRLPIYHFDTYRLGGVDEFLDLGSEEYLASEGVCLIEWADRVEEALPEDLLRIQIRITGATAREFHLTAYGRKSVALLRELQEVLGTGQEPPASTE